MVATRPTAAATGELRLAAGRHVGGRAGRRGATRVPGDALPGARRRAGRHSRGWAGSGRTPLPAAVGAPALDGLGCVAFPGAATAGFAGDVAGSLAVAAAEGFPAPAGSPAAGVAAREGLPARRPVTALAAAGVAPRAVGRAGAGACGLACSGAAGRSAGTE